MQTVRKLRKRSGFTLVELLIVIIIIGILAGAMLLVAGSGTDKAEATKIISDLRSLKAAALMYYADGNKEVPSDITGLQKYMDRKIENAGTFQIDKGTEDTTEWYVGKAVSKDTGVAEALEKAAKESGLWKGKTMSGDTAAYTKGEENVWMRAR